MALHWWTSLSLPLKLSVAALHIALTAVPASCSVVTEADVLSSVNACIGRQCHSLYALALTSSRPMEDLRACALMSSWGRSTAAARRVRASPDAPTPEARNTYLRTSCSPTFSAAHGYVHLCAFPCARDRNATLHAKCICGWATADLYSGCHAIPSF